MRILPTYHICRVALSEKGWTNNYISAQWFERCFVPQATARNVTGKTILLIYDGHQSHETIELREAALEYGIELYCLPPHTSHWLQPLDVGVFGPLQHAWQNRCVIAMDETGEGITRQQVIKHYMLARAMSFKDKTVLSAWKKSGISPLNPEIFTQRDFGPSFATSIKPLFPASFQSLLDSGPESRGTGVEDNEDNDDEDEDMVIVPSDWSPESNCGVEASDIGPSEDPGRRNDLPILAQPVTTHVSQDISLPEPSSPSESSIPPPSAPPLIQQLTPDVPAHCVPSEGGESPSQLGDRCHRAETSPILPASIPYVSPHQTRSLSRSAS